jgi:peroxiredoxin
MKSSGRIFKNAIYELTYPVIIDPEGEIYKKFGTGSVPYHVIIDRDFRISLSQEDFRKDLLIKGIQEALEIFQQFSEDK